jgi:alanine-synthesizing transaminase
VRGWDEEDARVLHLLNAGVLAHPGYYYGLDAERDGAHLIISCLTKRAALAQRLNIICSERLHSPRRGTAAAYGTNVNSPT